MNNSQEFLLQFAPDTYSRYFLITTLINDILPKQATSILEVGGRGTLLNRFLEAWGIKYTLTVIDPLPPNEEDKVYNYIQADATSMSFADDTFSVVISTDVLEHVAKKDKSAFIEELLRVAKDIVILAAPFNNGVIDYAEHLANDFYKKYTGQDHIWLIEHFTEHKPQKAIVEKIIHDHNYPFVSFGNNNIENWLQIILLNFLPVTSLAKQKQINEINMFFNQNIFAMNDFAKPCYRTFYVIFKNAKLVREIQFVSRNRNDLEKRLAYQAMVYDYLNQELRNIHAGISARVDLEDTMTTHVDQSIALTRRLSEIQKETALLEHQVLSIEQTHFFQIWQLATALKRKILHKRN